MTLFIVKRVDSRVIVKLYINRSHMNGVFFLDFTIGQTIFINLQNFIYIVLQVKEFDDFIELKFLLDVFYCRPDVI